SKPLVESRGARLADDRGPGGRHLAAVVRARRRMRGTRRRDALPLRPLHLAVERNRQRRARRLDDDCRARGSHHNAALRHARLPPPADAPPQPNPAQQPHPPLLVGGSGTRGTAEPAARFADEYNTPFASPEEFAQIRAKVAATCDRLGRDPTTLRFSLMTG